MKRGNFIKTLAGAIATGPSALCALVAAKPQRYGLGVTFHHIYPDGNRILISKSYSVFIPNEGWRGISRVEYRMFKDHNNSLL